MSTTGKPDPCHCDAYPFPHREFGGACEGEPRENTEAADAWWTRKFNGRPWRNEDERLDDPRHNQAKHINAGR